MPHSPSPIRSPSVRPSARFRPSTSREHRAKAAPLACSGTSQPGWHAWRAGGPPAICRIATLQPRIEYSRDARGNDAGTVGRTMAREPIHKGGPQ